MVVVATVRDCTDAFPEKGKNFERVLSTHVTFMPPQNCAR